MSEDREIPEPFRPAFSEVGITDETFPVTLPLDQARALFERLGISDWDPERVDGRHCVECSAKDCLEGLQFEIVDAAECECAKCHLPTL